MSEPKHSEYGSFLTGNAKTQESLRSCLDTRTFRDKDVSASRCYFYLKKYAYSVNFLMNIKISYKIYKSKNNDDKNKL